jgi:putative nucleotidyltransferase with HDIG domain
MANSAVFGHSGEVKDIRQAMIFLGYNRIKSIATGMSVMHVFPARISFSMKSLWVHSYEVAFLAETLSRIVSMACPCECFLSGLLHDIGRIIFYQIDHERFLEISTAEDMLEREREHFGCTHADAGSWFAEENNMPPEIISTIRFHHKPSLTSYYKVSVSVVSLAEAMARTLSPRIEDDGIWTEEHDALLLEFGLRDMDMTFVGERFYGARLEIERFFSS